MARSWELPWQLSCRRSLTGVRVSSKLRSIMVEHLKIGFAGLGMMGYGMAGNLQKAYSAQNGSIEVWNRTKDKEYVKEVLDLGAKWVDSPSDLAKNDVVFTMLGSDDAVREVFGSYLEGKPKAGSIFVECSTVYPDLAVEMSKEAHNYGVRVLSAPVFGRPDAAKEGRVLCVIAGDPEAKEKVKPLLKHIGRDILDLGDEARKGYVMKLVGNFFINNLSEWIAEGMTLADKNGIPRETLLSYLNASFPGPILPTYSEQIANDGFVINPGEPVFHAKGGLKDASHILDLAKESGVKLPFAEITHSRLKEINERGDPYKIDLSSIALLVREDAGIKDPRNLLKPKSK